ncbi:hypothetical protein ES705_45732 [subsurface metagenome]
MILEVRKNFAPSGVDGLVLNESDNLKITLDKLDIDLLKKRGFTTNTGHAGAKITILLEDGLDINNVL